MRYRTETFSGSGERSAVNVMSFEIFELGNTDIFDTLKNGILKENKICKEFDKFEEELIENGYIDDFSEDDRIAFMKKIIETIKETTGKEIRYALWLADIDTVKSMYNGCEINYDIDSYQEGNIVLSELGYDGTLYGYENMPKKIKEENK